jgi:hypothetical protein
MFCKRSAPASTVMGPLGAFPAAALLRGLQRTGDGHADRGAPATTVMGPQGALLTAALLPVPCPGQTGHGAPVRTVTSSLRSGTVL